MIRLEHVGIAVQDAAATAAVLRQVLGQPVYKTETVEREGVRTHFVATASAKLELLEALGPESPVAAFLEKRGPGLHHLAFEVDDLDAAHARLAALGFQPLSTPRPGADAKRIFFLHPKQTERLLLELCASTPAPLAAERVAFRGGHLAAYPLGSPVNPPLVLVHGAAGATALETEALARRLEPFFYVLALDLPGHGASDALEDEPFSMELFAEGVRALLDAFELPRAHLFGYSMGGGVVLEAARRHPGRVARVAVLATNPFWTPAMARLMQRGLLPERLPAAEAKQREAVHGARWPALHARVGAFVATLPGLAPGPDYFAGITVPTLVAAPSHDVLFPLDVTRRLSGALPQATLAVLPGAHALATVPLGVLVPLLLHHHLSAA